MTKLNELSQLTLLFSEQQLHSLLNYAEYLNGDSYYSQTTDDIREEIEEGLNELKQGQVVSLNDFKMQMNNILNS